MNDCFDRDLVVGIIGNMNKIRLASFAFIAFSFLLIFTYFMFSLLFPSRNKIYKKYFRDSTGKNISEGRHFYNRFINFSSVEDEVLLNYYYIYLLDNNLNPKNLNEYIEKRLSGTQSLYEMEDSFLKLLAIVSISENITFEEIIAEENRSKIKNLIMNNEAVEDNLWHWYFQYAWGVQGYMFGERFDEIFLKNLSSENYKNLIEMLSRSGETSFTDYLYPIINYSFIGIETPYSDIVSKDEHQFLYARDIRRYIIENLLIFKNDKEPAIDSVINISPFTYKIWLNLRRNEGG